MLAWTASDRNLLTLIRWQRRRALQVAALVLTSWCDDGALALLVSAGATACLPLALDATVLEHASCCAAHHGWRRLTRQKRQVALLLAHGQDTVAIATLLGMSRKTVEYHTGRLLAKLEMKTRLNVAL
jgi:DNA-binding NarL/FixJ family response regulator